MTNKQIEKLDANWVMNRKSRHHGLEPIRQALKDIQNPQNNLKIIHVAGTNGKGSTVNYCKDILVSLGFQVGTFTSPHLEEHYDRIRINGKWIAENRFNTYLNDLFEIIEKYDLGMFEIALLIALVYFNDEKVDYVLLEVGVGGRLDNTNVIENPVLEIITSIGLDHMRILGNRYQQIAYEKAGIIKKRSTVVVSGRVNDTAKRIIQYVAHEKQANCIFSFYQKRSSHTFEVFNTTYEIQGGSYQKRNAALALYAIHALGFDVTNDVVKEAVYQSKWLGRFEKISDEPLVYVDGAHNVEGMMACVEAMKEVSDHWIGVFAALKDKQTEEMYQILQEACEEVIICEFDNHRIQHIEEYDKQAMKIKDYKEAIDYAIKKDKSVIITGSLYFVSLVRKYLYE